MQHIKVNLEIPVPDDYIVIAKVELEELEKDRLKGVYWTMADLESRIGKKQLWIKENILYVPKFKQMLDVQKGGFVHYPRASGDKWSFLASKMADFLEKYFGEIFK